MAYKILNEQINHKIFSGKGHGPVVKYWKALFFDKESTVGVDQIPAGQVE